MDEEKTGKKSSPAELSADDLVRVVRHRGDHRQAVYRAKDIRHPHFDDISGGINLASPTAMLCGYVWCDGAIEGEVAHSGAHGPCPHSIKVMIQKNHNDPRIWHALARKPYTPPPPMDMSEEAVARRRERAKRAARTRSEQRRAQVEQLTREITAQWPRGQIPSAEKLAYRFATSKSVAVDARRKAVAARRTRP